jgi:hypothetical protein
MNNTEIIKRLKGLGTVTLKHSDIIEVFSDPAKAQEFTNFLYSKTDFLSLVIAKKIDADFVVTFGRTIDISVKTNDKCIDIPFKYFYKDMNLDYLATALKVSVA